MSYYDYENEPERLQWWLFAVGVVVGALLLGSAWGLTQWAGWEDEPSKGSVERQAGAVSPEQGPRAVVSTPELCRTVYAGQAAALRAGDLALSRWRIHIGAMNQLVTGVISLRQATAFWDETRIGARRDLDRYESAQRAFEARTIRCPRPSAVRPTGDVARCAAAVDARQREVRTLRVALRTWRVHVGHMEMLRHGHMSPTRATQLWLATWRDGLEEVRAYRTAVRKARGEQCPTEAASSP